MSLAAFYNAGYCAIPLRGGRPAMAGALTNNPSWRFQHGDDARFRDCDVGLLCSGRPLAGATGTATLAAVSATWVAGIRWQTTDRKLGAVLAAIVERIAGQGPTRTAAAETLRVFRVTQPFLSRRLGPMYLPREKFRALSYTPHRFEIVSIGGLVAMSGGDWHNGSLPEVRRDELTTLTTEQARQIIDEVRAAFNQRGASPWQ